MSVPLEQIASPHLTKIDCNSCCFLDQRFENDELVRKEVKARCIRQLSAVIVRPEPDYAIYVL